MPGPDVRVTGRSAFEEALEAAVAEGGRDAARRICELCVATLPVSGAAITAMSSAAHQDPIYATDEVSTKIDELQFRLAEGPCVQAFESGVPVLVTDITVGVHDRWPVFAIAAARDTTARGMYVFPLSSGKISIGVLDFYRDRPVVFAADDVARALLASDAAFWTVLGLRPGGTLDASGAPTHDEDPDELGPPLERPEVYQATGMIIAQLDVSADAALARLRGHAFVHDQPIDVVARDVVARRLRFTEEG